MSPGKRKTPEGTGADAITRHHQPQSYTDPHTIAMLGMAWRIRWLSTRRSDGRYPTHWFIAEVRRHQAECRQCRRCDPEVAA